MTPIEWIAAVLAVWVFVKFVLMSVNPKGFVKWAEKAFMKPNNMKALSYVELILFFLFAYLILQEISIVQFFIAMMAGMFLVGHLMMHYPKVMGLYIKEFKGKKNPNAKIMFDWLIWLVLSVWVLKELFF